MRMATSCVILFVLFGSLAVLQWVRVVFFLFLYVLMNLAVAFDPFTLSTV